MADGRHEPIPQVQAHDKVQTENPETGKMEVKEVLSTSVRTTHDVVTVTTADAKTHKTVDTLTCTPEHPWHTAGGWVLAGNLAVGTSILTRAGPAVVVQSVAKKHSDAGLLVYNLIVQDDHTYFVGNQEQWVHNGANLCLPDRVKTKGAFLHWAEKHLEQPKIALSREEADTAVAEARKWGITVSADAHDLAGHPGTNWPIPHIHFEPDKIRLHIPVPSDYVIPPEN